MTTVELLRQQLVGKKLRHKNVHRREEILEVEDVKVEHHSIQITPDTPQNDWWGQTKEWDDLKITFVNGSSITVGLNSTFDIVE